MGIPAGKMTLASGYKGKSLHALSYYADFDVFKGVGFYSDYELTLFPEPKNA
jgi:hypothetical protein